MKEMRYRIPFDQNYAEALGEATYCFSYCEWTVVSCIEKLQAGYASNVEPKKKQQVLSPKT